MNDDKELWKIFYLEFISIGRFTVEEAAERADKSMSEFNKRFGCKKEYNDKMTIDDFADSWYEHHPEMDDRK